MKRSQPTLDEIFEAQIQVLATTLRPGSVDHYRSRARSFLAYLHATFPELHKLSQLRRDPQLLSWFRSLCQRHPPLCNRTRTYHLLLLRRLLRDLADNGHPLPPDLIRRQDFPPPDHYLPRPLPPEEDQRLEQQLRHTDTLPANALRLIRGTGIRLRECIDLPLDCLRQASENQWALHVPLGKLHSERWVPVNEDTRLIVARILELRQLASASDLAKSEGFFAPSPRSTSPLVRYSQPSLGRGCQSRRLHQSGDPAPTSSYLCHRNAPPGRQPARSHATAGTQRHPHDPSVCAGHAAGPTTRISPRSPKLCCPTLHSPTPSSAHFQHQPSWRRPLCHS